MMESDNNITKYKNYPEGSGGRMLYDKHSLPIIDFFAKYYLNNSIEGFGVIGWTIR